MKREFLNINTSANTIVNTGIKFHQMKNLSWPSLRVITLLLILFISFYILGITKGYRNGFNAGADRALDTVNVICAKQVNSDTTVTELVLVHPDTNIYFLSKKTIKP